MFLISGFIFYESFFFSLLYDIEFVKKKWNQIKMI